MGERKSKVKTPPKVLEQNFPKLSCSTGVRSKLAGADWLRLTSSAKTAVRDFISSPTPSYCS